MKPSLRRAAGPARSQQHPQGLCSGEEDAGGLLGSALLAGSMGPPYPQHSPCDHRAIKEWGGVSGSVFVWIAVLFGINLLFQLLKVTIFRVHASRVNVI